MHHQYNRTRIFGNYAQHIPIQFFIMKEYIDLLIEDNWRKQDEFDTLISDIEKLPSPKERNIALLQDKDFINV